MINLLLQSIVKKENLYIDENETLRSLIKLMKINDEGVVVILKDQQPVGILTERDVIRALYNRVPIEQRLDRMPRRPLVTAKANRMIGHALNLMIDNNIRRLIITDDDNKFLGVVMQHDMLQYIEDDYYRSSLKVKHIVDGLKQLISVSPADTLQQVLTCFVENNISAVPVVHAGKASGIITEKDILNLADRDIPLDKEVSGYMSSPVISSHPDSPLVEIVNVMKDRNIRRVVINDDREMAVNMLTIRDIFRNIEGDYSKFLERKLKNTKDVLNLMPEMLLEITDTGEEQLIIWANEKFRGKFGGDIRDRSILDFIPKESWSEIHNALIRLNKVEHIKFKKDNEIYELSGYLLTTDDGTEKGRFQLILRDITEEVMLSVTDSLTGIYNRRFINEFLIKEIERSKRANRQLSILIGDLDNFKSINDIYGHPAGDKVLQAFTDALTSVLRKSDVVGRYGGDEFVIILPETNNANALYVLSRLQAMISRIEVSVSEQYKAKISASFGFATFPDDGNSSDALLIKSDSRLYINKQQKYASSPK